ncbi:Bug family tripartite tricarboxylate transporter substrate binding protein [Pseudorhodoferax sp.]|uniref:Bug family tripartite tricarboxylate transporter substrate binding protein n=1 Tax=Pseudorhodoferax sp. TaxID=1993553 RepID=UPI0039E4CAA2
MRNILSRVLASSALLLGCLPAVTVAEPYPSKPIEIIVSYQPGGGTDSVARAYAEAVKKHIGQSVVVVNKPGASGTIGLQDVASAKPDGYRLGLTTIEMVTLPLQGIGKFTYEDFTPIAKLNSDPSAVTVLADSPWKTMDDFIADAKKRPNSISMGNSGTGTIWHLAAAALEEKTQVKFNHIPFPGSVPAVLALLGGHIQAVAVSPGEVSQYVQAGKLRMLGVMTNQRVKGFENVPTLKEQNIDLTIEAWRGISGPKNMPEDVVNKLRAASEKAVDEPAFRAVLEKLNFGLAYADAPAFHQEMVRDDTYYKPLLKKIAPAQ